MMNIDTARSYATEANLNKSLADKGLTEVAIVVRNRAGRWTAICSVSRCNMRQIQCGAIAHAGFFIIN